MKYTLVFYLVLCLFLISGVFCGSAPWSPPINRGGAAISSVISVPSNSSTCPGGIDIIIDANRFPCIGGAGSYPVQNACENGLTGIQLNNTLVCGLIGKPVPAGNGTDDCLYGGVEFISNTINTTLCHDNPLEEQEIATLVAASNYTSYEIALIITQLNNNTATIASLYNQMLVIINDIATNTADIAAADAQITAIQGDIANLIVIQNALIDQLGNLTATVSANSYDIEALKYNVTINLSYIYAKLANDSSYLEYLNNNLVLLKQRVENLNGSVIANTNDIVTINAEIGVFNGQLATISTDVTNLQASVALLDSQFVDLNGTLYAAQLAISAVQVDIASIQSDIISILYSINHINDRFVNSSSFTFNIGANNTVSGSVFIGVNSATSGGYDLWNSANGAVISLKQIFGITNFLDFTSTPTGLQLVSSLAATNLPYTTYNPSLFPDCSGATLTSELISCLAGRTLSVLNNATNAATVLYTPQQVFRNLTQFSVAFWLDLNFANSLPQFTRIIHVDCANGDALGNGMEINPFGSLIAAMDSIGTNPFNEATEIIVHGGSCSDEGDLLFKPNTYIVGRNARIFYYNLTGAVYLASNWAYFAGAHVEGGIDGIVLKATLLYLNFSGMGPAGINSFAKFSFSQCEVDAPIFGSGRGSMDFVQMNTVDMHHDVSLNCLNSHMESCPGIAGNVLVSDNNCSSPLMNHHILFNYFQDSNYTVVQSTSTVVLDAFLNGWDGGYFILKGNLTANTYTIPSRIIKDNTVTMVYNLNLAGSVMCNLSSYFSAPCLNADEIILELAAHGKTLRSANTGFSLLYYNDSTTNVLNDLASTSPFIPISSSSGLISIGFVDPTTLLQLNGVNCYNNTGSIVCDSIYIPFNSSTDCPTGGVLIQSKTGNYPFCFPYDFNATTLGFSFTSDAHLNITNLGGLQYFVSFISNLYSTNPSFLNVTKLADGSVRFAINTPVLTGSPFIQVIPSGINNLILFNGTVSSNNTNLLIPSINAATGDLNFNIVDPTSNSVGSNGRNCISHGNQTICDNFMLLNSTTTNQCPSGFVTIVSIQGSFSFCVPFSTITYLTAGSFIQLIPGINAGNYTIAVAGSTITNIFNVSDPNCGTVGGFRFTLNGANYTSCTPFNDVFVAGANIVITNGIGGNNRTLATTLTPSFTTVALTATTNQAVFGTTTTTTLNIPTPSSSRTHTLNDPGTNSFFVMGDGDQTINGIKSFNSAPVSRSSVGHKFNNVGNTATTTVIPSVSLVSNNNFPLPSNNPSANQVLMTDGQNSTWTSTSSLRGVTITYCSGTADKSIAATNADRSISPGCGTDRKSVV